MPRRGNLGRGRRRRGCRSLGRGRRRGMVRLQTMTDCEPRPCYGTVARKHTCEKERGHQDECGCRHGNHWINPERWEKERTKGNGKDDAMTESAPHVTHLSETR